MKRILFFAMVLGGLQMNGQSKIVQAPKAFDQAAPMPSRQYTGQEAITSTVPVSPNSKKSVLANTQIGETFYDLQTNGSVDNRIQYDPATGQVSATWTNSTAGSPFNDRGTGYNFYNGTTWGSVPTNRIESIHTGWPSIVVTDTSEFIVAHSGSNLVSNIRATPGFGSWTENTSFSNITDGVLWPRAVGGGPDGRTVHVIAITTPVANGGSKYKGFDGALIYWRSADGGYTWEIQDSLLPGIDTADFSGVGGDSYAIDVKGNTVAIAVFDPFNPSFLLKSTDNGDTWTQTIFQDPGFRDYDPSEAGTISDVDNDGVQDTVDANDGSGAVLIDNNGLVHIFVGNTRSLDDDPLANGASSYFPGVNGLLYWNENSTKLDTITGAEDLNNDGQLNIPTGIAPDRGFGIYGTGLSSMPSVGVDANNKIFVAYTAIHELQAVTQVFRKIFYITSTDNGSTWSNPREATKLLPFVECVYPSMARTVDSKLRMIFQLDGEPGIAISGDEDAPTNNEITYLEIDTTGDIGITELDITKGEINGMYPNPATDEVNLDFSVKMAGEYTIQITNITGVAVKTIDLGNMGSGTFKESVNLDNLTPGVYIVSLVSGEYTTSERLIIQ